MTHLKLDARALDILRTACTFVCIEDCCAHLKCVRFEATGNLCRVIATDRHQMIVAAVKPWTGYTLPKVSFHVPAAELKAALAEFKAKRGLVYLDISFDGEALAAAEARRVNGDCDEVATITAVYEVKAKEKGAAPELVQKVAAHKVPLWVGRYVEYKRAIPSPYAAKEPIGAETISAKLLENISRAALSLSESRNARSPIRLTTTAPKAAVVAPLAPDAFALVMPMIPDDDYSYSASWKAVFPDEE